VLAKPLDREALRQALAPSPRGHVPAFPKREAIPRQIPHVN